MNNVNRIINKNKCVKCGACVSVCPELCVKAEYNHMKGFYDISIDADNCLSCGRCTSVCPAISYLAKHKGEDSDSILGKTKKCILAYSSDNNIRKMASSGGVINALTQYIIDFNIVDEAYMVKNHPGKMQPQIAVINKNNIEDLRFNPRDFASRYISYPVLKEQCSESNKKMILVGTPCQINAARKSCELKHNKNVLFFGVTCSGAISELATRQLVDCKCKGDFINVYYRGEGWPGKNSVQYKADGKIISEDEDHMFSLFNAMYLSQVFRNNGCRYCTDHFAEKSDLSFFDFWNEKELSHEKLGKTGIIIRTEQGQKIIDDAIEKGYIFEENEISKQDIINSQKWILRLKKTISPHNIFLCLYYEFANFIRKSGLYKKLGKKGYRMLANFFLLIISGISKFKRGLL